MTVSLIPAGFGSNWYMEKFVLPSFSKRRYAAVAIGIGVILVCGASLYYEIEFSSIHASVGKELQTIADLKISQIIQWHKGMLANARSTVGSPFMEDGVQLWQKNPEHAARTDMIKKRLRLVKSEYAFRDIFMVSTEGKILLRIDSSTIQPDAMIVSLIQKASATSKLVESDFYISTADQNIYYDIIAPVRNEKNQTMAVLVFRTSPSDYLYPVIQSWPVPSKSSETLLLRKEGDSILYLNDLKFRPHSALNFRMSLNRTDLPAVQAALGVKGIVEGRDYRGMRTLAYLAPIPNTSWYMVAKIDSSEIFAELTYRLIILVIVSALLILFIGSVFILYYRSRQLSRSQFELEKEKELRRYHEELQESQEKYRVLVEHATDGIFLADAQGLIVEVNPSGCAMLGFSRDELLGTAMEDLISVDDIRHEPNESHAGQSGVWERRMIRKDGSLIPVEFTRKIMPNSWMQKIVRDISERREIEFLQRDIQRREAVGVLSAGIAHDFNNLLAVMMGNVSLAQMQLPEHHPVFKYMGQTLTAIESAAELTRQILAYSGKGKFQIRTIDMTAEVRTHATLFANSTKKNVKLVIQLPSTPILISGDPGQIKQVIMNLIINGADAIGENNGTVTVTISSLDLRKNELSQYGKITSMMLSEGRYALLEVSDDGIGMAPETMHHIFDPFFTTKFIGRGLGLSAVLGIIRSHDGGITIESSQGEGTTFRVILPMKQESVPKHTMNPDTSPAISDATMNEMAVDDATTGHCEAPCMKAVLVIDDEEHVAAIAREILESADYKVLVELNAYQGIELYKKFQSEISVVLLDMTMPEMSGNEVVRALQAINPDVKIIISSGYSEHEVHKKIGLDNVSGFIQKPYPLQSLLTKVQHVMTRE
jgi:PAS domain S-box-containing protein